MKPQIILCFCIVSLWLGSCFSHTKKRPASYVVDDAEILTEKQEGEINTLCAELESRTGSQMVVNTIDTLNGITIEKYANKTFNTWGIGRKDINGGILIVVAIGDRKTRIEVGYGLENIITDSIAAGIIDQHLVANFRANRFYEGIMEAAKKIKTLIETHREKIGEKPDRLLKMVGPREEPEEILPPSK